MFVEEVEHYPVTVGNYQLSQESVRKEDDTSFDVAIDVKTNNNQMYLMVKRMIDIIVALGVFAVLFIPMVIIGILIRLDSPGPAIFKQERLGKNGKPFVIYKFRSMRTDAEKNGPQWANENDDRCTRIGKKIRDFRIDELPQFWNILNGTMSIVGPRPERECFYREFTTYIPEFPQRLAVTPGLTGHAQVNGGYDLKPEEKIVYDMHYIKHQSLLLDLKCIIKTISIVFSHEGAR